MTRLKKYARWLACIAVGLAVCTVVILCEKDAGADYGMIRMICDGCYVAGIMLTGVGALIWISNLGGFNALGYAGYLIKRKRFSSNGKFEERLSYLEYVQIHGEKEKKKFNCLILTGLLFIAAACVFLYFYWR